MSERNQGQRQRLVALVTWAGYVSLAWSCVRLFAEFRTPQLLLEYISEILPTLKNAISGFLSLVHIISAAFDGVVQAIIDALRLPIPLPVLSVSFILLGLSARHIVKHWRTKHAYDLGFIWWISWLLLVVYLVDMIAAIVFGEPAEPLQNTLKLKAATLWFGSSILLLPYAGMMIWTIVSATPPFVRKHFKQRLGSHSYVYAIASLLILAISSLIVATIASRQEQSVSEAIFLGLSLEGLEGKTSFLWLAPLFGWLKILIYVALPIFFWNAAVLTTDRVKLYRKAKREIERSSASDMPPADSQSQNNSI